MLAALKTGSRSAASSMSPFARYFVAAALPLILLSLVALYFICQSLVLQPARQEAEALADSGAQQAASRMAQQLRTWRAELRGFAEQQELAAALQNNETSLSDEQRLSLGNRLPALAGLRLIPAGKASLDRDAETPIRFTELDMIKRAEAGQNVPVEVSRVGQDWRLGMVEALTIPAAETLAASEQGQTEIAGLIFASFSAASLMPEPDSLQGKLVLAQQFPNQQAQDLISRGQGGEANEGPRGEAAIAGSHLRLRFQPGAALLAQAAPQILPFIAGSALIMIMNLALAYTLARLLLLRRARSEGRRAAPKPAEEKLENLQVREEDSELLGIRAMVQRKKTEEAEQAKESAATTVDIAAEIFRAYDIRGVAESQLSAANVVLIGQAIGSEAVAAGETAIIVARDGRNHSPDIAEQLIEGIMAAGCNVINIGQVPTPLMYFACHELDECSSGVMVTASHNPPEYNGFKIVIKGNTLKDAEIQRLRRRILQSDFSKDSNKGSGREDFVDVSAQYVERIFSDVALAGEFSMVVDAGNGVTGELAPRLFEELGCQVTPLYCEIDGNFPNHPPDPSMADNLQDLVARVAEVQADLGVAFDGDGDRVVVVTASGRIVAADRLMMMLARDIVSRNPGADVVYDVKCSRELTKVISSYGGRPVMWKAGHSHMKAKMKETAAVLGGELSGHIFIGERWYGFDDGLYAAARVLEIMSLREQDLDSILEGFPDLPATPEILVAVSEQEKFDLVERLIREGEFGDGRKTTIDGLRVDFPKGWGLVRASNTSAALTLRFEAESEDALDELKALFRKELAKIAPALDLEF